MDIKELLLLWFIDGKYLTIIDNESEFSKSRYSQKLNNEIKQRVRVEKLYLRNYIEKLIPIEKLDNESELRIRESCLIVFYKFTTF